MGGVMSQEKGKPSGNTSVDEANIFHDYITDFSRRADLNDDQREILQNDLKVTELAQNAVISDFLPSQNQYLSLRQKASRLEEKFDQIKAELEPRIQYLVWESEDNRLAQRLLDGLTAEYQKQSSPIIQEIAREGELRKKAEEKAKEEQQKKAEEARKMEEKEREALKEKILEMTKNIPIEAEKRRLEQIREFRSLEAEYNEERPKIYTNQEKLKALSNQIQKLIDLPGADAAVVAELRAKQIEIQNKLELIGKNEKDLRMDFYLLGPDSNPDTRKTLDLLKNFNHDTSSAIDNTEKFINDQKIKLSGTIDDKIKEVESQRLQERHKVGDLEGQLKALDTKQEELKQVVNADDKLIQKHTESVKVAMGEAVSQVHAQVKNDTARWYDKIPLLKNFFEDEHLLRQYNDPRRKAIDELSKNVETALQQVGKDPPGMLNISQLSESLEKNEDVKSKLDSLNAAVKTIHRHYQEQAKNKSEHGRVSGELAKAKDNVVKLDQQEKALVEMKNKTGDGVKFENTSQKILNG